MYIIYIIAYRTYLQHDNEVSNTAESRRIPVTYGNDDEDLAGSGEIEGSAGEDVDPHLIVDVQHRNIGGSARKYLLFYKIVSIN